jgi:hypothetical protein
MPGQNGRAGARWVATVSVVLAGVLLSAVGFAALRSDTAAADTVLARGSDAVLELPDGTTRAAVPGETVPNGATVRAGRTGARLDTRDREVHLGGASAVTVVDGVRQVLRSGFVLVDASDAPGVEVRTDSAAVTAVDDSLVRVDAGALLRVGVLRGGPAEVRPVSRRSTTEVPTYFQVQVPHGGLPGVTTPFVLTPGDRYEALLARELVTADADLTALASRLDAEGRVGPVVLAALRTEVPAEPTVVRGAPASEAALGYLIAEAAAVDEPLGDRYAEVRELRTSGGSWGVVAAIVRAPVERVGAALNALLAPGTVPVVASQPLDIAAALGLGVDGGDGGDSGPGDAAGAGRSAQPAPPSGGASGGGSGSGSDGRPAPAPSPTRPPSATDPITSVVDEVVDTVREIVSPSPSPSSPRPVTEQLTEPVNGPVTGAVPSPVGSTLDSPVGSTLDTAVDTVREPLDRVLSPAVPALP